MADKKFDDKELEKVSGGMVNELDGSYSFYAGLVIYMNERHTLYLTVKYASNWVDANYKVPCRYHITNKLEIDIDVKASDLQKYADQYGCKYN